VYTLKIELLETLTRFIPENYNKGLTILKKNLVLILLADGIPLLSTGQVFAATRLCEREGKRKTPESATRLCERREKKDP